MPVLRRLDAAAVRRWCTAALTDLRARRQEIDDLNVYPVPDGDAGTNMVATMESVEQSVNGARSDDLAGTMKALARGALVGARGNSGVILSQVLSGFAEVLGPLRSAGGEKLKDALDAAVSKAYAAVAHPAEGTILTVAKGAAQAARAVPGDDFAAVIRAAATGAREALEKTTEQLPALKAAGVVDAGGRGLVVVLEALARVMGVAHEEAPEPAAIVPRDPSALVAARESGSSEFGYEVQFLLDAADGAIGPLKATLDRLGDSLVVVGGNALYNVHVHVNDVGAALEAAVTAGHPHRISVIHFADQIAQQESAAAGAGNRASGAGRLVIAAASGPGLCRLYEAAGALVVPADITAPELESVIKDSAAEEVVLLPNSTELLAASRQLQPVRFGCHIHVVPTRSPVQGMAALAVHHPEHALPDDVIAMTTAAAAMRWGEISAATDFAETSAGSCRPGDFVGSVEGVVVAVGADACDVAMAVLLLMLGGTDELLTLVAGESLADSDVDALTAAVRAAYPLVHIEPHRGEQTGAALLMGVE